VRLQRLLTLNEQNNQTFYHRRTKKKDKSFTREIMSDLVKGQNICYIVNRIKSTETAE